MQRTVIGAAGGQPPDWLPRDEFFIWADKEEKPRPPSEAGAALLKLLDLDLLPGFAAGGPWLEDLVEHGASAPLPPRLCWAAEDAILLAPYKVDGDHWGGFLIACLSAKDQSREFADENGQTIQLSVPESCFSRGAMTIALANAILSIC